MALHGRRARLLLEYEKLINLEKRSDFIKIEPIDWVEGMPPENYVITFTCRGIVGLNPDNSPKFDEFHQVSMKLSSDFPNKEPYLKWLTPIWHPNIEHKEPKQVCINSVQNWYSTKSLDDLVISLGEMVQYKHYHAAWVTPFPRDTEAADWVLNFAEPNGIVAQDKPVDTRQLLREKKIRRKHPALSSYTPPKSTGRLKLGIKKSISVEQQPISVEYPISENKEISVEKPLAASASVNADPVRRRGITLGLRTKEVMCVRCYNNFTVPNILLPTEMEFVCEKCREFVRVPH